MHITTRIATTADWAPLYSLYQKAMKGYIEKIWGWNEAWQQNHFRGSFETAATYVIESDSGFAGYYQVEFGESSDWLQMLVIIPGMRSLGIGHQLLERLLKTSHDAGKRLMLRVFKMNANAKRFYQRNGWIVVEENEIFYLMENSSYPVAGEPNSSFQRTVKSYAFVLG